MGYLANFMVYTLAMVGVIAVALLIFKNATTSGAIKKSKYLSIIDTMSIGPRKTLYIVSAGHEKFLIAGDVDKTSLISKLESASQEVPLVLKTEEKSTFKETMENLAKPKSYMDKSYVGIRSSALNTKGFAPEGTSVIRSLANKMRGD